MSKENKYLQDFLNLLDDDQVFHSYLSNTFMLNQIGFFMRELNEGSRSETEVERDIQDLMKSIEILAPDPNGQLHVDLTKEEFYALLKNVKQQTIQNLAERRRN